MSRPGRSQPRCRCCQMPSEATLCGLCTTVHSSQAADVRATVRRLWGSDGLVAFEAELWAQRNARLRAARLAREQKPTPRKGTAA